QLGDMMRFMLHENQQDHILLIREIAYIKEYIALQKLRIADLPSIQITVELPPEDQIEDQQIAPMLLIPFIENAFKHGISLNKPSWIRIYLSVENDHLRLNVYNSIHTSKESDPDRHNSGIGLKNVRNRLNLLYSDHHQFHIEETNIESFIFLTLQLIPNQEIRKMIRAVAIDDEPLALEIVSGHAKQIPFLQLEATFVNAFEAMDYLNNNAVDLLFLDIKMPDISGIEFFNSLSRRPLLVFATAYSEHAITGFELDAIDYLLKLFTFVKF